MRLHDILYTLNPSLRTRVLWAKSVDTIQTLLIPDTKYFILNVRWLRFELMTFCHTSSDTILRKQLNQNLKLIIKPQNILYILNMFTLYFHIFDIVDKAFFNPSGNL